MDMSHNQKQQQQQHGLPTLPTVPVSSFLLPTGNTTSIVSGHINEGKKQYFLFWLEWKPSIRDHSNIT